MAVIIHELRRRKRTFAKEETREYIISGATGVSNAEAIFMEGGGVDRLGVDIAGFSGSTISITGGNLALSSINTSQIEGSDDCFNVTAKWDRGGQEQEEEQVGGEVVSFDVSPQTVKITQSLDNVSNRAAPGIVAPDFEGGIGWNGKTFTGCDKIIPSLSFTLTKIVGEGSINNAYVTGLAAAAGHCNNALWRGFAKHEVLFVGMSGSRRDADAYTIAFKFLAQNSASVNVGKINGIPKKGWEQLWVTYEDTDHKAAKFIAKAPYSAHVERIYDEVNFTTLFGG